MTTQAQPAQPYAKCQDCDLEFANREEMTPHMRETVTRVREAGGLIARGHRVVIVNPTEEERRASRVRMAVSDALDKLCEELWDDVARGYFTAEEVKAELWAFDIDTAWEEFVAESEDGSR